MTTHELKILPRWFEDVEKVIKNFEIRRNDRDYKVGDVLRLKEYDRGRYSGREIVKEVEYIYKGDGTYGLSEEFCILGLKACSQTINTDETRPCSELVMKCKNCGRESEQYIIGVGVAVCKRCGAANYEDPHEIHEKVIERKKRLNKVADKL